MQGRDFLDLAREILAGATEVHWRGAVGRAYYALLLEGREALFRWGFPLPPRDSVHAFVRLRFVYAAEPDLKKIGTILENLSQLRNRADYDLSPHTFFADDRKATNAVQEVTKSIALLDAIENDAARRSAAIAAIQKAFP